MIPVRMLLFVMFTFWLGQGSNENDNDNENNKDENNDLIKYIYGETDADDEIEIYDLPDDDKMSNSQLERCYYGSIMNGYWDNRNIYRYW